MYDSIDGLVDGVYWCSGNLFWMSVLCVTLLLLCTRSGQVGFLFVGSSGEEVDGMIFLNMNFFWVLAVTVFVCVFVGVDLS